MCAATGVNPLICTLKLRSRVLFFDLQTGVVLRDNFDI